jgi:hypothetical protein
MNNFFQYARNCVGAACLKSSNTNQNISNIGTLEFQKGKHIFYYYGEIKDEKPNGKGELYLDNKTNIIFEGEMKDGMYWNGVGTLYDEDAETILFTGEWKNGFKKEFRIANSSNSRKSGEECLEGRGRPEKPKNRNFINIYLEQYPDKNVYGCKGYMMYDFETAQYCCSDRPRTPLEMIQFLFMMLESIIKTYKTDNPFLRTIDKYFTIFIEKVPIEIKSKLLDEYNQYIDIIERENSNYTDRLFTPLSQENAKITKEHDNSVIPSRTKKRLSELRAYRKKKIQQYKEENP